MTQYALLVGVGSFENGLDSISFVEDDVNGFCQVLLDSFYIPYDNIECITNETATHQRVMVVSRVMRKFALVSGRNLLQGAA